MLCLWLVKVSRLSALVGSSLQRWHWIYINNTYSNKHTSYAHSHTKCHLSERKFGGDETHSIPMERSETPTTIRSRMLKEFLQNEPLCKNAPYVVIWNEARQGKSLTQLTHGTPTVTTVMIVTLVSTVTVIPIKIT